MVDLLVVGYSVRALARSALAAGLEVATIDGFGDRDLVEPRPAPVTHGTVAPFDVARVLATAPASRRLAWTSTLENAPGVLQALGSTRQVLGNGAAVVSRVRQPEVVSRVLAAHGLPTAQVFPAHAATAGGMLRKPRASGGGHGVDRWLPGEPVGDDAYLQEEVAGEPGSLLFLADGSEATPVMLTRQLVGEACFGASGYTWCGNLAGPGVLPRQDELAASAAATAAVLTRALGLRGLNGIDFIARGGEAVVIEVNPRWTASVELAERAMGVSLFPAHVRASAGELVPLEPWRARVVGKAVVYATDARVMGTTDSWLVQRDIRDVPPSGSTTPAGAPVCTVLADGDDAVACRRALELKADWVRAA